MNQIFFTYLLGSAVALSVVGAIFSLNLTILRRRKINKNINITVKESNAKDLRSFASPSESKSIWDFLIATIEIIYNLLSTGNIIGVILLWIMIFVFYTTYKIDPLVLSEFISNISVMFSSEKYYLFPLLTALAFSIFVIILQRRIYRKDIQRLKDIRKKLIFELEDKENIANKPINRTENTSVQN